MTELGPETWLLFTPFAAHQQGLILSLLYQSYAAYLALDPQAKETWPVEWAAFDCEVFRFPDTVGACGFVTSLGTQVIGFASWDPRGFPDCAVIGHNCILPAFRGRGYGTAQMRRVLCILRARGFARARVTTMEHPFFAPAQRMYQTCGFCEVARGSRNPRLLYRTIDYELPL